jgi:hypothetical protein
MMTMEPAVFYIKDRPDKGRRYVLEIDPLQPPPLKIDSHLMDDPAITIQEQGIRFFKGLFDLLKGRRLYDVAGS